jgi:hypothetical protein
MNHSNIDQYHSYKGIPAMTSPQIHKYLEELGKNWTGQGVAMELGCWLGASSLALLKGLTKAGYDRPYWCFDAWRANQDQLPKAKAQGVTLKLDQDTLPIFIKNVTPTYPNIVENKGSLPGTLSNYNGDPIEICLFDAPKTNPTFNDCITHLQPSWIPGVTILGLLDYYFYRRHVGEKRKKFRAPVEFMEKYGKHFKLEKYWEDESVVFFRYLEKFN